EQGGEAKEVFNAIKKKYPFSFHTLVVLTGKEEDPSEILSNELKLEKKNSSQTPLLTQLMAQIEVLKKNQKEASARKILDWAIAISDTAEPEIKLTLADLKGEEGDYVSKIFLLSEILYRNPNLVAKQTLESYFPKLYFPFFEKNDVGLDPLFLLSVARQESAFNPNARSTAKAKGLLQLLNATARRYFPRGKMNLYDPETNITIGARYLQSLLQKTNNQVPLVLAAYNAGEARVSEWLKRYRTTDPILFIDLIPYRETRDYVASILRNYYWYRKLHGDRHITKIDDLFIVRQ
ncbi:MAG TPA: lytic transglycosylase domain-containing protein, partial [Pyrinomonadaceae bacterium]|nr:lytic transglycosylase domain-containing protein [Pyrinomonadaceae bacterium]